MDRIQVKDELGRLRVVKKLPGWYIGSKSRLLGWIWGCIQKRGLKFDSMLDGFAGSSTVGYFFKQMGKRVVSVDMTAYAYQIAKALKKITPPRLVARIDWCYLVKESMGISWKSSLGTLCFVAGRQGS